MTEPEINEQIAKFDGWKHAFGNHWKNPEGYTISGDEMRHRTNYSQDETALRQALGKLSEEQRIGYVSALRKIWVKTPNRFGLSLAGNVLYWLLFEVSTATKARVLAEVVKEVK